MPQEVEFLLPDMLEVYPVINCSDVECVAEKLRQAEQFSDWVHLDVSDARFTFNRSWGDPEGWQAFKSKVNLEVHLMVEEPERVAEEWFKAGAKRLIVHVETLQQETAEEIVKLGKKYGASVMLAANPETRTEALAPYTAMFKEFQALGVIPGPSGQGFQQITLEKIKFWRKEVPDAVIEVDGGVTPEVARLAKDAGADIVVSATHIFDSNDPKQALEELKNV